MATQPAPLTEPAPAVYQLLGGETGVRALVDQFYDLMEREPAYAGIKKLHPADMSGSRNKLFWFLSGWLGGPQLYEQRFGHPRLRMRHMPFPIGAPERDQWMACMLQALEDRKVDEALKDKLMIAFFKTADWMRNTDVA